MSQEKVELKELLSQLAGRVQALIAEGKFVPTQRVVTRLRFSGYRYEEDGPNCDSFWFEEDLEADCPKAVRDQIMNTVRATDEYQYASNAVTKCFGREQNSDLLSIFTGEFIRETMAGRYASPDLISNFIKFLYREPRQHRLRAELEGLLLFLEEIKISDGENDFFLRQATQKDAEKVV